jgi:hypothetical protein
MSNSLYLEAITEAKQLKEAAEANAKKAIIDAMAPQIKRLVERELLEESDDTTSENFLSEIFGLDEEVNSESSDLNKAENLLEIDEELLETISSKQTGLDAKRLISLIETFQNTASLYNNMNEKDDAIYEKFELIASNLLGEAKTLRDDVIRIVEGEEGASANSSLLFTLDTIIKETNKMSTRSKDEVLYELDLSELDLFEEDEDQEAADDADLDLDVDGPEDDEGLEDDDGEGEGEDDEEGLEDDLEGGPVELELDPEDAEALLLALKDALGDEAEEATEDEVEEVDELEAYAEGDATGDEWIEIDEGMLRREIAAMRSLSEAPDLLKVKGIANDMAHIWGGKGSGKSGDDFGGGKRGKDPLTMSDKDLNVHAENKQLRVAFTKESRKNRELTAQLQGAVTAVTGLQGQLKEMNLFNAKLLYANKLLQNKNISTRQMRSIVESLDKARSLREVKLLYKTMTESFTSKKKSNGSLNESAARKAVGSSRPTRRASAKSSDKEVDRWATLAGLK